MHKKKKFNNCVDIQMAMEGLRFLSKQMYHYKWYSPILPIATCVSQIFLSIILMILPKTVLDAVELNCDFPYLLSHMMGLGFIFTIASCVNFILHNEISKISQMFLFKKLKPMWEQRVMRMDYPLFLSNKGKIIMEKARNAIDSPNWGIVEWLGRETELLEAVFGLIVCSVIVCKIHFFMLVILGILFLTELFYGLKIEKKKQKYKDEKAKADRKLNYLAYGTKGMKEAKDIRLYGMAPWLRKVAYHAVLEKDHVEADIQKWQFKHTLITAMTIFIRDGSAYIFLLYLFFITDMSLGDFSMYFSAVTGIGVWLGKLVDSIARVTEVKNYVMDFYCFVNSSENYVEIYPDHMGVFQYNPYAFEKEIKINAPISIELQQVSYSYHVQSNGEDKKITVIKDMDLSVNAGEKIAIVGINGAGKSTLIKLICGMLIPEKGRILVNGIDIKEIQKAEFYKLISAVFQNSKILPVSIADNLMPNITEKRDINKMWRVLQMAGLDQWIKALPEQEHTKLVKRISERGMELSGGQEQRLLLARALYKNAPILVLDEPTSALDPISERDIYEKYHMFTKGKTAFFVSHRLASTRFCDKILFLENGKICESGTHAELMQRKGNYADMFLVQSEYYQSGKE